MRTTLSIDDSKARELYNVGCGAVKTILEESFGKNFCERGFCDRDIKERVKTYEDACRSMAMATNIIENQTVILIKSGCRPLEPNAVAYMKLCTIIEALNEGWKPNWNNNDENKYFPRFVMSPSSFAFDDSDFEFSLAYAGSGSRLFMKSRELSDYCGKQFIDLWRDVQLG